MPTPSTYLDLPVEGLYQLLVSSTKELVEACDSQKPDAIIAFRAAKKQVELILDTIEEKKAMEEEKRKRQAN